MSTTPERFVGIDVSKGHLDVHVRPDGLARRFDNTPDGIALVVEWVAPLALIRLALEVSDAGVRRYFPDSERSQLGVPKVKADSRTRGITPRRVSD